MFYYLKSIIYSLSIMIIGIIIITIFNYFNIISGNLFTITLLLIPIIAIFIGGYLIGSNSIKKGFIEGIKFSIIWILLFFIISISTKGLNIFSFIYYLIIIITSMLSGIIGINKKKK